MFLLIFCFLLKYTYYYNYRSRISLQVGKLAKSAQGQILIFPTVYTHTHTCTHIHTHVHTCTHMYIHTHTHTHTHTHVLMFFTEAVQSNQTSQSQTHCI